MDIEKGINSSSFVQGKLTFKESEPYSWTKEKSVNDVVIPSSSLISRPVEGGSQTQIIALMDEIKNILLNKNRKYGDSALNPSRIFSKANSIEQIKVRLDDKISRIMSGQVDEDEDILLDLIGYLVLLIIALRQEGDK